jgi:UDP-2,3-diacylglucosamine hydrolase
MTGTSAYFVSDAHLGDNLPYPERRQQYLINFFERIAADASHLFILGDLFDFWIEYRHGVRPDFFPILHALKNLVTAGIRIDYVSGNHDFALGDFLSEKIGIAIHPDHLACKIQGRRLYLVHGDGLIKADTGYHLLKWLLRNRHLQNLFKLLPPDMGIPLATSVSMASRRRNHKKRRTFTYRDYRPVAWNIARQGYDMVLMGHTHQPELLLNGDRVYCNLGDWIGHYTYARLKAGELNLLRYRSEDPPEPMPAKIVMEG